MVSEKWAGRVVAQRYELLERLGSGAAASVYSARHLRTGRVVAVKLLHSELWACEVATRRLQREARMLAKLRHDHIVEILDARFEGDEHFLVMPLLRGEDLDHLLCREGRLAWPQARALMLQVCAAVAYAHTHGIVHRDLKPANCILIGGSTIKVLDLGVAKLLEQGEGPLTVSGHLVGTPGYLAPEQISSGTTDARADVYAAGAMLFRMLTGRLPFVERGPALICRMTAEVAPTMASVSETVDAPAYVEQAVARALARHPEDRFASVAQLARALAGPAVAEPEGSAWWQWLFWVAIPLASVLAECAAPR